MSPVPRERPVVMSYRDIAVRLRKKGYEPIPLKPFSKIPIQKNWTKVPWSETVFSWPSEAGIGVRTGRVSGFDIDVLDVSIVKQLLSLFPPKHLQRIGKEPKVLIPILCPEIKQKMFSTGFLDHNKKLNRIEVLSYGQQFVAYGIHPDTNLPYSLSSELFDHTPVSMTLEQVKQIFAEFERLATAAGWKSLKQREEKATKAVREYTQSYGGTPKDRFNQEFRSEEILARNGWKHVRGQAWRRPGKGSDSSASVFSNGLVYVHTTSTVLVPNQVSDAFEIFAMYEHDGDKSQAAIAYLKTKPRDSQTTTKDFPPSSSGLTNPISEKGPEMEDSHNVITLEDLNSFSYDNEEEMDIVFDEQQKLLGRWMLTDSINMIHGGTGIGKSWVVLTAALSLATGHKILPEWESHCPPMKVLVVDGEMTPAEMRDRKFALLNGVGETKPTKNLRTISNIHLLQQGKRFLNLSLDRDRQVLKQFIVNHGFKVVFIDNLSCLIPGINTKLSEDYSPFNIWLIELKALGVVMNIVHHDNKGEDFTGANEMTFQLQTRLHVKKTKSGFTIEYPKGRHMTSQKAVDYTIMSGKPEGIVITSGVVEEKTALQQAVFHINNNGGELEEDKLKRLLEDGGKAERTINNLLHEQRSCRGDKKVIFLRRGFWCTDAP